MDKAAFDRFIKERTWIYAKSYANTWPHEYTLRNTTGPDPEFDAACLYIREQGYIQAFFSRLITYLNHDTTHYYWTMPGRIQDQGCINRALYADHDHIPKRWDIPPGTLVKGSPKRKPRP